MAPIRNTPCPTGRAMGEQLDRFYNEELARLGLPDARCGTCAFRAGTHPNGCLTTVADALRCVVERGPSFNCHERADPETGSPLMCVGFMVLAHSGMGKPPVEMPWPFSDEAGHEGNPT
jgi:hypothetical protein